MKDSGRVLAVGAHPDDVEFGCAGTLSLLHKRGCSIHIATVTNGDCGSTEHAAEEIALIRKAEAAESAALLDAPYTCLDEGDLMFTLDERTRRKMVNVIREVDPCIVLTHPHEDYMADHEITSRLVRDACFGDTIPNFASSSGLPATSAIPALYYWDAMEGIDHLGRPTPVHFRVDVSTEMDVKSRMLTCHRSQREWLLRQHGMDHYIQSMVAWSERRGGEAGVAHAEAFCQHRGHAYPRANLLAEILGENMVRIPD